MPVTNLTEARVRDLPLGSGIWRDDQAKGLMVVCHRTTKTYAVQGDVRRNGRFIRTVRMKIDRCERVGLREARRRAKELMSQIQSGVDPTATPESSGITLSQVLDSYIAARDLADATVGEYRYHLDKYLKRWRNRAVADISRGEVRDLYDELKGIGQTKAGSVMRTLRALINEARRMDDSITSNPVSAVRVPQGKKREVPPVNLQDWWKRVHALTPIRRDLYTFFLFTGLRRLSAVTIKATPGEQVNVTRPDTANRQGGAVQVNIINNAPNTKAGVDPNNNGQNGRPLDIIIDELVAGKIKSPNSKTNKSIRSTFGADLATVAR